MSNDTNTTSGQGAAFGLPRSADYLVTYLRKLGNARNRDADRELREVTISDEDARELAEALSPCAIAPLAGLTLPQELVLRRLCASYSVPFHAEHYTPQMDLPDGYVAGWVGGLSQVGRTIYVGVSRTGESSS